MAWQDTLEKVFDLHSPDRLNRKRRAAQATDRLDSLDTNNDPPIPVQCVQSVHSPEEGTSNIEDTIPSLTPDQAREVEAFPPETRRVYDKIQAWFLERGYEAIQAQTLALVTVWELQRFKGSNHLGLVSDLPSEIHKAAGNVLDVFPGSETAWCPE